MRKLQFVLVAFLILLPVYASAAPYFTNEVTLLPLSNNSFDLGTSTKNWRNAYITQLCLSGDCKTAWPSGGVGSGASSTLLTDQNTWSALQSFSYASSTALSGDFLCIGADCRAAWPFSSAPGGSDTQVQFNDDGDFGGNSGLIFDKTNGKLTVGDVDPEPRIEINPQGTNISFYNDNFSFNAATAGMGLLFQSNAGANMYLRGNGDVTIDPGSGSNVGVSTTSPGSMFSIGDDAIGINFTLGTSSWATSGGLNISDGCYAVDGVCLSSGGSGTPAGDDTALQFNNSGTFGGTLLYYTENPPNDLTLRSTDGQTTDANGVGINITGGNANGAGAGADIWLTAGNSNDGTNHGGDVALFPGYDTLTHNLGKIFLTSAFTGAAVFGLDNIPSGYENIYAFPENAGTFCLVNVNCASTTTANTWTGTQTFGNIVIAGVCTGCTTWPWTYSAASFAGQPSNSTSTSMHFAATGNSLSASSTALFDQINVGSTTLGTMSTSTFYGNANVQGVLKIGTASIYLRDGATSTFSNDVAVGNFSQTGTATSTHNRGITLAAGCYAVLNTCIGLNNLPGTVSLTTQVTGDLPFANLAQVAAGSVLGNPTGSTADAQSLATSTLYGSAVTPGYVLTSTGSGWTPMATATCLQITGSAGLCDGDDATGAGGGTFSFIPTTWNGSIANSTTSDMIFSNRFAVGSSTPASNAFFEVGTSSPLIHINSLTAKTGFGCENAGTAVFQFGCGTNANVNPNIKLLVTDPVDARMGVAVGDKGVFVSSGDASTYGGIFSYNYAGGVGLNLALNQFGGNVGVGNTAPSSLLTVGTTTPRTPISGTLMHLTGPDGAPLRISYDTFNSNSTFGSLVQYRRARGTAASPSAVNADDTLMSLGATGWGTTGFISSPATIALKAGGTFTDASSPTFMSVFTTPENSITSVERFRVSPSGNVGVGTTTPWATFSVASSSPSALVPLFAIGTSSTDITGNLVSVFSTTTTLVSSSTGVVNTTSMFDSGVRIVIGAFQRFAGLVLDQLNINGRINTGEWFLQECSFSGLINTLTADTYSVCPGWSWEEDNAGQAVLVNTPAGGIQFSEAGGAVANDGNGIFAGGNVWMSAATNTPVIEFAWTGGAIGANNTGTSTMVGGFVNINPAGTAFEVEPTAGCYVTASSSNPNLQGVCRTSATIVTQFDTGVSSSTNYFNRFRIEMSTNGATFYVATPTTTMKVIRVISGVGFPSTNPIVAGIYVTNPTFVANAGKGPTVEYARLWFRKTLWPN